MRPVALAFLLVLAGCATAQPAGVPAPMPAAAPAPPPLTDAERAVQALLLEDGVHVVHFWAPWCDNSLNELAEGWYEVVEANPEVDFAFVTVWNDDAVGEEMLARYAIPERVARLVVPAPKPEAADRRMTFLGLPVSWIPTTWVFNRHGQLAYAFNYGELTMPQLQQALDGAARAW